jgi:hypothetical protein
LTKDKYRCFANHHNPLSIFDPRNEYNADRIEFRKRIMEREHQADAQTDELEDASQNTELFRSLRRVGEQTRLMWWLVMAEATPPALDKSKAGTMLAALEMPGMRVFFVGEENSPIRYRKRLVC